MAKQKAIKAGFLELLSLCGGNVQSTVSKMGESKETRISRGRLYVWKNQDRKFSDEWDRITDESRQEVKEGLISALIRAGLEGNVGAIALYFKLVEGWTEKKEFIAAREEHENPRQRFHHPLKLEDCRTNIKAFRDKLTSMLEQEDDDIMIEQFWSRSY